LKLQKDTIESPISDVTQNPLTEMNRRRPMKFEHYENGDSEFTFEVTMRVGAEDGDGSSVTIGGMGFNIERNGPRFFITDKNGYLNDGVEFINKLDAIEWLIEYVGGK